MSRMDDPPPVLSLRAQWTLLQHSLNRATPYGQSNGAAAWVNSLDRCLLATALAKQTSELELLQAEAQHVKLPNDMRLPHYYAACASPPLSPAIESPSHFDFSTPATPLSPDFGPRQGSEFSGTVNRRRSLGPPPHSPRQHNEAFQGMDNERLEKWELTCRDQERRIQWEAAWFWIERRLEYYVDKFADRKSWRPKGSAEIWEDLVRVKEECHVLKKKIWKSSEEDSTGR